MQLNELKSPKGSRKRKKIVGRGKASGTGKTSGRGENGQKSRTGRWAVGGSEGGQMRLIRRLPKVGFRCQSRTLYQVVNVERLNNFEKNTEITAEFLKSQGLINSLNKPFKILGKGKIEKSLIFKVKNLSKSAKEKIIQAGGKIES